MKRIIYGDTDECWKAVKEVNLYCKKYSRVARHILTKKHVPIIFKSPALKQYWDKDKHCLVQYKGEYHQIFVKGDYEFEVIMHVITYDNFQILVVRNDTWEQKYKRKFEEK